MKNLARWILIGGMVLALAGVASAAMASNSVPASNAGQGAGQISGYTITNIHYAIDGTYKTLGLVAFTISPIPKSVKVWFGNGTGNVYGVTGNVQDHCSITPLVGANPPMALVSCNNLVEPIDAINSLNVSAAQ